MNDEPITHNTVDDAFAEPWKRLRPLPPLNSCETFYRAGWAAAMSQPAPRPPGMLAQSVRFSIGLLAGMAAGVLVMLSISSLDPVIATKPLVSSPTESQTESLISKNPIATAGKDRSFSERDSMAKPLSNAPLRSLLVTTYGRPRVIAIGARTEGLQSFIEQPLDARSNYRDQFRTMTRNMTDEATESSPTLTIVPSTLYQLLDRNSL